MYEWWSYQWGNFAASKEIKAKSLLSRLKSDSTAFFTKTTPSSLPIYLSISSSTPLLIHHHPHKLIAATTTSQSRAHHPLRFEACITSHPFSLLSHYHFVSVGAKIKTKSRTGHFIMSWSILCPVLPADTSDWIFMKNNYFEGFGLFVLI